MARPPKQRTPTVGDVKKLDPTNPKTLNVERRLDDEGLLQRSPSVDRFIISELGGVPTMEVERRYVVPAFPHDAVDDPFKDWYHPFKLADLCERFKIPLSTFNRVRIVFHTTDGQGNELHYPIMLGRTLWRAMNRLKLSSLRAVVEYYNAKRAVTNAARKEKRDDKAIDAEFAAYQRQVDELGVKLDRATKIIAKLRLRLTPEHQAKLDQALVKAGITL